MGLRNRNGGVLSKSKLAEILKNRAYVGKVVFRGVEYEGKHEPIVSNELFSRVQDVFSEHDRAGIRQRRHGHYLRGTLFCGRCGARFSSVLKFKGDNQYEYFYCLGMHARRTECTELYVPTEPIEKQIETLYGSVQIPADVRRAVERDLKLEVAAREKDRGKSGERASRRLVQLAAERDKLLRAYYADAIPVETLKREQDRIDGEVDAAEGEIALSGTRLVAAKELIELCLKRLANCARAYKDAVPADRRKWNQAFFEKIFIKGRPRYGRGNQRALRVDSGEGLFKGFFT